MASSPRRLPDPARSRGAPSRRSAGWAVSPPYARGPSTSWGSSPATARRRSPGGPARGGCCQRRNVSYARCERPAGPPIPDRTDALVLHARSLVERARVGRMASSGRGDRRFPWWRFCDLACAYDSVACRCWRRCVAVSDARCCQLPALANRGASGERRLRDARAALSNRASRGSLRGQSASRC